MLVLQIIAIALLSVFMGLVVYVWVTTLEVRKDIDDKLAGYIVDANRDYILRLDILADQHQETFKTETFVKEKLEDLTSHKVKTFRDFDTGLLNNTALEIYGDKYRDHDILYFSMIKVAGIEAADRKIEDVLQITAYAANRIGIELFKAAYKIDKMCDIYRIDYERFLIISIDSMVLEIMTNITNDLMKHHEVASIFVGSSHRKTRKKDLNKCITIADQKLKEHIENNI